MKRVEEGGLNERTPLSKKKQDALQVCMYGRQQMFVHRAFERWRSINRDTNGVVAVVVIDCRVLFLFCLVSSHNLPTHFWVPTNREEEEAVRLVLLVLVTTISSAFTPNVMM